MRTTPQLQQAMKTGGQKTGQDGQNDQAVTKEDIVAHVKRLKAIYEDFLGLQGSKSSPALFKCGEKKIASRVVPHIVCQLYVIYYGPI